jgi:hypothetical protein
VNKEIEEANKNIYVSQELENTVFEDNEYKERNFILTKLIFKNGVYIKVPILKLVKSLSKIKLTLLFNPEVLSGIKLDELFLIYALKSEYNINDHNLEYKVKKEKVGFNYIITIILKEKDNKNGV